MGWANCGEVNYKDKPRLIGYAIQAVCDHPRCRKKIDRGLSYACGDMHGELGGVACNGYFCDSHKLHEVPAEGEDILADFDTIGSSVKTVYVCLECFKSYRLAVKEEKAALKEERRIERSLSKKK